jgi:DNA-binding transcriptional regulator YhcF (GntR family)
MSGNQPDVPDPQRDNAADNLYHHLLYLIATGKWLEGTRLPSIRTAEKLFGASRTTVQQAYQMLANHRLVESKPKSGYIVKAQPGNAWISRNRSELKDLYEDFSKTILTSTGLAPLPVLRYLTRLAAILDHESPSCAFIECTDSQADDHAREIKDRLGISVLPLTVDEVATDGSDLPRHIKFAITTLFHQVELSSLQSRHGIEMIAVPIEVSPVLKEQVASLKRRIVFLETEGQMAQDISDDARQIMNDMPISTMTVECIADSLSELLGQPSPNDTDEGVTVMLSPRDWGRLDDKWRGHPHVRRVAFSICESAWDTIAEFLGMPIGPLG